MMQSPRSIASEKNNGIFMGYWKLPEINNLFFLFRTKIHIFIKRHLYIFCNESSFLFVTSNIFKF